MKSIRSLLLGRLLAGGLVLLGAAGLTLHWAIARELHREFDDGLLLSAQSLRAFVEQKDDQVEVDSDVDDISEFHSSRDAAIFLLADSRGLPLKASPSLDGLSFSPPAATLDRPLFFESDLPGSRKLRCVTLRFQATLDEANSPDQHGDEVTLTVGRNRQPLEATLSKLRQFLALTGAATLVTFTTLLWWGVRRGLAPLDHLVAEIAAVDATSLAIRLSPAALPLELQPIAGRLNQLLERLGKAFDREKRFTADVAHELRTPLAEMRTLAEVNLIAPLQTPQENAANWQEVAAISLRMESLAVRLLELARAEQSQWEIQPASIVPAVALSATWTRFAALAAERQITLSAELPADLRLHTDPVLFDTILTNLVGNAIHHASRSSSLEVTHHGHTLRFRNRADDLRPADLPLLFERFWKKDDSRRDARRHGLGLSLARELATLLGGSLTARLTTGPCVEFVWEFPQEAFGPV